MKRNYLFWTIIISAAAVLVLDAVFAVVFIAMAVSRGGTAAAFPVGLWVFGIVLIVINAVMLSVTAAYFISRKIRR